MLFLSSRVFTIFKIRAYNNFSEIHWMCFLSGPSWYWKNERRIPVDILIDIYFHHKSRTLYCYSCFSGQKGKKRREREHTQRSKGMKGKENCAGSSIICNTSVTSVFRCQWFWNTLVVIILTLQSSLQRTENKN